MGTVSKEDFGDLSQYVGLSRHDCLLIIVAKATEKQEQLVSKTQKNRKRPMTEGFRLLHDRICKKPRSSRARINFKSPANFSNRNTYPSGSGSSSRHGQTSSSSSSRPGPTTSSSSSRPRSIFPWDLNEPALSFMSGPHLLQHPSDAGPSSRPVAVPRGPLPNEPRVLPSLFREKVQELGGSNAQLMLEKVLCSSDVTNGQSRLTMSVKQSKLQLTEAEIVDASMKGEDGKSVIGFEVDVFDPMLQVRKVSFKKWPTSTSYVFNNKGWNKLVEDNKLVVGNEVQVWSFRAGPADRLCFAIVRL